jgi:hypothetical protein
MSKRTRGFDKLWRWQVTDDLEMPNGEKITVTAKRLNKQGKEARDKYTRDQARAMNRALDDTESDEYKEHILPLTTLSTDDLLRLLEYSERVQLTAKAQREFLSPSPSDREDDELTMLKDRLDALDREDEILDDIEKQRTDWVKATLVENMAVLKDMERDELLKMATRATTEGVINGTWWTAFTDASLRLGVFVGDKPFFKDWPTDADDDLKAKLLQLDMDADAASFDFSF